MMVVTGRNGEISKPSVALPMHTISTAVDMVHVARDALEKLRPADYGGMSLLAQRTLYYFFSDDNSEVHVKLCAIFIHFIVVAILLLLLYCLV